MTTHDDMVQPPRTATWLVVMFASEEKDSLEGDLLEEFSDLAARSGAAVARRWYWRQTLLMGDNQNFRPTTIRIPDQRQ